MWEKFDESSMGIVVRHIKRFHPYATTLGKADIFGNSSALPDYVFDEGERQPRLAQKRPKPTKVCKKILILRPTADCVNLTSPRVPENLITPHQTCQIRNDGRWILTITSLILTVCTLLIV